MPRASKICSFSSYQHHTLSFVPLLAGVHSLRAYTCICCYMHHMTKSPSGKRVAAALAHLYG
uniref:Uncharacterized protein n=1 Tax=Arundo donax TaxID=35708 RepID=A0A0A9GDN4_ARUDO